MPNGNSKKGKKKSAQQKQPKAPQPRQPRNGNRGGSGLTIQQRRGPVASGNKSDKDVHHSEALPPILVDKNSDYLLYKIPMSCKDIFAISKYREMYQYYELRKLRVTVTSTFSSIASGGYLIGFLSDPNDEYDSLISLQRALTTGLKHKKSGLASNATMTITQTDIKKATSLDKFYTDASKESRLSECGFVYIVLTASPSGDNSATLDVRLDADMRFTMPTTAPDASRQHSGNMPDSLYQIKNQQGMFLHKTLRNSAPTLKDILAIWPELPGDSPSNTMVIKIDAMYSYNEGTDSVLNGEYIFFHADGRGRHCYFSPIRFTSEFNYELEEEKVVEHDHYQMCVISGTHYRFVCETIDELNEIENHSSSDVIRLRHLDKNGNRTGDFFEVPRASSKTSPVATVSTVKVDQSQLDSQTVALAGVVNSNSANVNDKLTQVEETLSGEILTSRVRSTEQHAVEMAEIAVEAKATRTTLGLEIGGVAAETAAVTGVVSATERDVKSLTSTTELYQQQNSTALNSIQTQVDGASHKDIASLITGKTIDNYDLIKSALSDMSMQYQTDVDSDEFRDSLNLLLGAFEIAPIEPLFDVQVSIDSLRVLFSQGKLFPYHGSAFPDAKAWPNYYNLGTSQFPTEDAIGLYIRTQLNNVLNELPVYTYLKVVGDDDSNLQFQVVPETRVRDLVPKPDGRSFDTDDTAVAYSFRTYMITSFRNERIHLTVGTIDAVENVMTHGPN